MHRLTAALALTASLVTIADAKPRRHARRPHHDSAWMTTCIHERTGPTDGITVTEARRICKAEAPDDEVSAAKSQLALAKANAKVAKARAKAAKAIEACEQAVVDACVEAAQPDGSSDCEDNALKPAFAQCH